MILDRLTLSLIFFKDIIDLPKIVYTFPQNFYSYSPTVRGKGRGGEEKAGGHCAPKM